MNTPPDLPDPDDAIDARLRDSLGRDPARPPEAVRGAILEEARRIAARIAAESAPAPRAAANDTRWRLPVAAAAIVAVLAVLVARPLNDRPPAPVAEAERVAVHANAVPATPSSEQAKEIAPQAVPLQAESARAGDSALARVATPAPAPALQALLSAEPEATAPLADSAAAMAPATESAAMARKSLSLANVGASAASGAVALIDAADAAGRTPLSGAVEANDVEAVTRLLAAGADPTRADAHGDTPLALAERHHYAEIVRLLRAAGAR